MFEFCFFDALHVLFFFFASGVCMIFTSVSFQVMDTRKESLHSPQTNSTNLQWFLETADGPLVKGL
jgi:hypothetical protein